MKVNHSLPILTAALITASMTIAQPAVADSKTDAVIGRLGLSCKNEVLGRFNAPNSDINVNLGSTLQQDIDSGAMTADDLKQYGASFNWSVNGKNASGYCNVDGQGNVVEFVTQSGAVGGAAGGNIDAVIDRLGLECKKRVAKKIDARKSDINISLGSTLQQDIDSGAMTVNDLNQRGASFDWSVNGRKANGYCNVDGQGRIVDFKKW